MHIHEITHWMKTAMAYKPDQLPQRKAKLPAIIEFGEPKHWNLSNFFIFDGIFIACYCYFFTPFSSPLFIFCGELNFYQNCLIYLKFEWCDHRFWHISYFVWHWVHDLVFSSYYYRKALIQRWELQRLTRQFISTTWNVHCSR